MAQNPKLEGKRDSECSDTGEPAESRRSTLSAAATSATSNQNGDQAGFEDGVMPEQEASDRRRSGLFEARSSGGSPLPGRGPADELPRRNFQIPRKFKERKGLYQFLPPESREFEDVVKIVSSFYLDSSSRGTFSYFKARLIHNELLEKEYVEKRRELKQDGRTEAELVESYCFLFPDKSKLPWICEKGLSVGHCRLQSLGNPTLGVYLSKYSDLLQINPLEVGTNGDIVIFKVMRGRLKHILGDMNTMPNSKFDCHLSKNASRVTTLLSYRAFEQTQQYFFEFAFDEIKLRPRHVCPYAVISFQYKGKESTSTPMSHRFNPNMCDGNRGAGRRSYLVWSGPLVNKGQELCHVCLRSTTRPYLPIKLPDKLELSRGMQLEQVKRKIPAVLFSRDTYSSTREVLKCGMFCSLFEVVDGKGKPSSGALTALLNKLERDRMVLVMPLVDKGFLFLLSSVQMLNSHERHGRLQSGRSLQALFIFQESRGVVKYTSRLSGRDTQCAEPPPPSMAALGPFIPALHYAFFKLRSNPGKDLSLGVERQSLDYLRRRDTGQLRPFVLHDYKQNMDERGVILPPTRPKPNQEVPLRSYLLGPASSYILPLSKARDIITKVQNPPPPPPPPSFPSPPAAAPEYSPVSDWGDTRTDPPIEPPARAPPSDPGRRPPGGGAVTHSNGGQPPQSLPPRSRPQTQSEYDKEKMKQLLKLIQLHKKALVTQPGQHGEPGDDPPWDPHSLKRKLEEEGAPGGPRHKHLRMDAQSNGEPSRAPGDEGLEEGNQHLAAVMESMGIYDADLRGRGAAAAAASDSSAAATNETQRLLKILLDTLNKALTRGAVAPGAMAEPPSSEPGPGPREESGAAQKEPEEDTACSLGSPMSTCSMEEQPHTSDNPPWAIPSLPDQPPALPDPVTPADHLEPGKKKPVEPKPLSQTQPPTSQPQPPDQPLLPQSQPQPIPVLVTGQLKPPPQLFPQGTTLYSILNQELHKFSSGIQDVMRSQQIHYPPHLPKDLPPIGTTWLPNSCFSEYICDHVTPLPLQGHVKALREKMNRVINPPPPSSSSSSTPLQNLAVTTLNPYLAPPPSLASPTPLASPAQKATPKTKAQRPQGKSSSSGRKKQTKPEMYSPTQVTADSPDSSPKTIIAPPEAPPSDPVSNLLFGQLKPEMFSGGLKPEMFSSLVEIFKNVQKNTVKFYIHPGDEGEESPICLEIKEYLKSLGNTECKPQSYLENSSNLDKLLIIIQNTDIAAHVHKIPALVSLKKCSTVNFAGVDTLDDVKNHTYNELFVSGGFIVSDEFVLNPDFITQERLQSFLKFLEERSSPENPWQWKVHCKSQKKLKELGRLNSNAMGLLSLLTTYQKKHLVEFLPYHECDTPSRQAPDVDCLIKLQSHHTQQRHMIFLTERRFEMFLQYSRNGIVIASIDDIMNSFHSLIGGVNQNELPTPPSTVVNDECVEEDMSIDSDEETLVIDEKPLLTPIKKEEGGAASDDLAPPPPLPESEEFRPPLPDQLAPAEEAQPPLPTTTSSSVSSFPEEQPQSSSMSSYANMCDLAAIKTALSQFKESDQVGGASTASPGGFAVNPHQSFLCPSTPWASFSGYATSPAYPASPASGTQEAEYRAPPLPTAAAVTTALVPAPVPPPIPAPILAPTLPLIPDSIPASIPAQTIPPIPTPILPSIPAPIPAPALPSIPPPIPAPTLPLLPAPLPALALGPLPLEVKPPPPPHLMHLYVPLQQQAAAVTQGSDVALTVGGAFSRGATTATGAPSVEACPLLLSAALSFPDVAAATSASFATALTAGSPLALHGERTPGGPGDESGWGGVVRNNTCETPRVGTGGVGGGVETRKWTDAAGGSTPGGQEGQTPPGNCAEVSSTATRGGSVSLARGVVPRGSYGSMGPMPGQMGLGGSLGGYRGQAVPPGGAWLRPGRPGRGHERGAGTGGAPCSWGYARGRGAGQDYYSDYT